MKGLLFAVLTFGVALSFAKEATFFFLKPYERSWIESNAVVVENRDGKMRPMTADADYPGWESFTWNADSVPDSVLIYRGTDSAFAEPIGGFGYKGERFAPIPMKAFLYTDSVFFVSDSGFFSPFSLADYNPTGMYFFGQDVREFYYFDWLQNERTLFVLVPDYPEWVYETLGYCRPMRKIPDGLCANGKRAITYHWNISFSRKAIRFGKPRSAKTVSLTGKRKFSR